MEITLLINESMLESLRYRLKVRLVQFGLLGRYDVDEVINEAIVRLDKALKSGKQAPNREAWIIATGRNYIREINRDRKKYQTVEEFRVGYLLAESGKNSLTLEQVGAIELSKVREALQALKPKDRELIELMFFKNLSWDKIARCLANRGSKLASALCVREESGR